MQSSTESSPQNNRKRILLASRLAAGLHEAGAPAHRMEATMRSFAEAWGLEVEFFALPTAVFISVGKEQLTLHQSSPGEPDLTRLDALTVVADRVLHGAVTPEHALLELDAIQSAPDPYGTVSTLAAFSLTGVASSVVFGAGLTEMLASGVTGLLAGAAAVTLGPTAAVHLTTTVAAALVGGAVTLMAHLAPLDSRVPILAGLLVLLPGFSLTVGMTELATGHRLTGSSRVIGAGLSMLQLGFGVALGSALFAGLEPAGFSAPLPLPAWAFPVSLLAVSAAFTVLLRAPTWAWPRIALATMAATVASDLGTWVLGPALAPALGALAVTALSNGLARVTRRPSALTQVPGILLLVPGSLGFEAIRALMAADPFVGVQGVFSTALAATGLVGGMLLGHALVPPDRIRATSASEHEGTRRPCASASQA